MRNVKIAYALSFLWRSWFWLGCWIFYYLRFTDYAGIGFLETIMITTSTLGEIPTGAIADIYGKKISVAIAFALGMIGNMIMAFAPNYWVLVGSIITMTVGGCFYSGSLQALVYDSLKEVNNEKIYSKVIGRMSSMESLGLAIAGIVGGYLYKSNVSLPFIAVALAYLIGFILTILLREPLIDSEKYSWKLFVDQTLQGFRQLFSSKQSSYLTLALLIPAAFIVATENVINDATAVELGFNSVQLGIFLTAMQIFGIFISEKTDWFISILTPKIFYILMTVIYLLTLIAVPWAGLILGSLYLFIRFGSQTLIQNYHSIRVNEIVDSRYRATTLSTFSLLRNIPYALAATGIGALITLKGVTNFSMYLGLILLLMMAGLVLVKPLFNPAGKNI